MIALNTRWRRIGLLGVLYLVQGLPFGFQVAALPIYLREQGVGLAMIGYSTALALPWALKFLWAPMVERFGGRRGQRKRWVVPLQLILAAGFGVAATVSPQEQLSMLMGLLVFLNLIAATQDIAVDGLAVDILASEELGPGNAAQVVGYKVGMLLSGGVLVWATARIGWTGGFVVMAAMVLAVALLVSRIREEPGPPEEAASTERLSDVVRTLRRSLMVPGAGWMLLCIGTYKTGESLIDVMFKPFLLDAGISASQIGLWLGTWGMGASVLGSVLGGWIAIRVPLVRALFWAGCFRLVPEVAQLGLGLGWAPVVETTVIITTLGEHLAGGILTTVMFATMMSWVDRSIGATHFTAFACVEVWGKAGAAFVSGLVAEQLGYAGTFGLGCMLGVGFLVPVWVLLRRQSSNVPVTTKVDRR